MGFYTDLLLQYGLPITQVEKERIEVECPEIPVDWFLALTKSDFEPFMLRLPQLDKAMGFGVDFEPHELEQGFVDGAKVLRFAPHLRVTHFGRIETTEFAGDIALIKKAAQVAARELCFYLLTSCCRISDMIEYHPTTTGYGPALPVRIPEQGSVPRDLMLEYGVIISQTEKERIQAGFPEINTEWFRDLARLGLKYYLLRVPSLDRCLGFGIDFTARELEQGFVNGAEVVRASPGSLPRDLTAASRVFTSFLRDIESPKFSEDVALIKKAVHPIESFHPFLSCRPDLILPIDLPDSPLVESRPMSSIGLFTFLRTYSRRHDEADPHSTIETWAETVARVVRASDTQLHVGFSDLEKREVTDLLTNLKFSVAGRFLWQLGTRTVDRMGLMSLQNCCATVVNDPVTPFTWAMNFSMLGAGIGVRALPSDVAGFPIVKAVTITRQDTNDADFIVPDSREGWVALLGKVLKAHFYSGRSFTYSCILLRSKGAPIKSFGGTSSGPEILCDGLAKISDVINARAGLNFRPIDALDVITIIGMIVVAGNVRRCLPRGALVHLMRGLTPVEDVREGDTVLTSSGYQPVIACAAQGLQSLVTIKTQDGVFECTANHRMAVMTGCTSWEWKEAQNIKADDRLMTTRLAITGVPTVLPAWQYEYAEHSIICKPLTIPQLDQDMCWLIGLFQGDGYTFPNLAHNGFNAYISIVFGLAEYNAALKAQQQLQRFGATLNVTLKKRKDENSYIVQCQSKQLAWYMHAHVKQANVPLRVPLYITTSTVGNRLAFLSGIADSDGALQNRPVNVVTTVYPKFARDIQALLYSCGIESRFEMHDKCNATSRPAHWQQCYGVNLITLRSQALFGAIPTLCKTMRISKRSARADSYPNAYITDSRVRKMCDLTGTENPLNIDSYDREFGVNDYCPVKVVSIEPSNRSDETFDIEVANQHEFYCNGYLTHNSALLVLGDCNDMDFLRAKRWDLGIPNNRCFSNNSVVCNDIEEVLANDEFWEPYKNGGECFGLINLRLMQSCGRIGDTLYPDPGVVCVNPCSEITLANKECCTLGELFLPNITSKEEFFRCARYAYRFCKHSTSLACPESQETETIMKKNRRLGIGITGYLQASEEQRCWLPECYEMLRAYDIEYSALHQFPVSIKLTTIKPSGTLSILGGVTPGIHPGYARYYIRRIRISAENPLVEVAARHGHPVEWQRGFDGTIDHTTKIVSFPCKFPKGTVLAKDCTAVDQLNVLKRLQSDWADNSCSITIYFRANELDAIKDWLRHNYNDNIKSVSFLLHSEHGFAQAPLEEISKEQYKILAAQCMPIVDVSGICFHKEAVGDLECVGGHCPVR